MSEIKVEKGVEMPRAHKHRKTMYPWGDMKEYGDSFFVPVRDGGEPRLLAIKILGSGRNKGFKVSTRCVEEAGAKGIRVWRIT